MDGVRRLNSGYTVRINNFFLGGDLHDHVGSVSRGFEGLLGGGYGFGKINVEGEIIPTFFFIAF